MADPAYREEKDLVARCRAGNREAWGRLVDGFGPLVWSAVRNTLYRFNVPNAPQAAEDIWQEVFLKLLRDRGVVLGKYKGTDPLKHFVGALAVNQTIDWLRRSGREALRERPAGFSALLADLPDAASPDPAAALDGAERIDRLRKALERLPDRERLAVRLFYYESVREESIGTILRLSKQGVASLLFRARQRLQEILKSSYCF